MSAIPTTLMSSLLSLVEDLTVLASKISMWLLPDASTPAGVRCRRVRFDTNATMFMNAQVVRDFVKALPVPMGLCKDEAEAVSNSALNEFLGKARIAVCQTCSALTVGLRCHCATQPS